MLKQIYLILISALAFSASLKADEATQPENEMKVSVEENDISVEETVPTEELTTKPEDVPTTVEANIEVPESELIEMVGYLTAQSGRIPALGLDNSQVSILAASLLEGLKGEKKLEDIPQESIQEAFSQAQKRGEALASSSEEVPPISEDSLQALSLVILEQSGLSQLGFGAKEADSIIKGFTAGALAEIPDPAMQAKVPAFQKFMQKRVTKLKDKMAAEAKIVAAERTAAAKIFFEELALDTEVQKSESGLYYKILEPGVDEKPTMEDFVLVHYKGTLIDGTQFDSSYDRDKPAKFPLNGVVPGFGEGLTKIGSGGKIILYIPSELGYGDSPRPGGPIKPGDTLIFECELIEVNPK